MCGSTTPSLAQSALLFVDRIAQAKADMCIIHERCRAGQIDPARFEAMAKRLDFSLREVRALLETGGNVETVLDGVRL